MLRIDQTELEVTRNTGDIDKTLDKRTGIELAF